MIFQHSLLAAFALQGREPTIEQRIEANLAVKTAQMHLTETSDALSAMAIAVSDTIDVMMEVDR